MIESTRHGAEQKKMIGFQQTITYLYTCDRLVKSKNVSSIRQICVNNNLLFKKLYFSVIKYIWLGIKKYTYVLIKHKYLYNFAKINDMRNILKRVKK